MLDDKKEKELSPYTKENIYSKVNISIKTLDFIIVGGVLALIVIIILLSL